MEENIGDNITGESAVVFVKNHETLQLPLEMRWQPKEDITTYELSLCLPFLVRNNIYHFEIDESLPHFRHFKIINHNK